MYTKCIALPHTLIHKSKEDWMWNIEDIEIDPKLSRMVVFYNLWNFDFVNEVINYEIYKIVSLFSQF